MSAQLLDLTGAVSRLVEDLVDIGINVLNPIQPNATGMETQRLKALSAGRLCYHGGIDLQRLLPFGSPEEVAAEAENRMAISVASNTFGTATFRRVRTSS